MSGVCALMRSKSGSASSTPASFAIASRCSTALVDPPVAATTAIAFSIAVRVMIVRGRPSELRELHRPARPTAVPTSAFARIGRRHAAAAERRDAERLADDRHRVRGELAAARARAGTRDVLEQLEVAVGHPAGGVRADGLEHVLNGHLVAVELPGRNRAAVEHDARACSAARAP